MGIIENNDLMYEFRNGLWNDIGVSVVSNNTVDREEFLEIVADYLVDAEEIEDFEYVPFEGTGKRNKKIQIDGYSYSELDECLSLFIVTPMTYDEDDSLTHTDINRYLSLAAAFLENAEYIIKNAEESAPGYELASDVLVKYSDCRKYKIYVISDKIVNKSNMRIDNLKFNDKEIECHVWDIRRIFDLSKSHFGKEEIIIRFEDFGIKGLPCILASDTDDYKAYLCNIPGIILANLYNSYGSRLLEGNVRSFLQDRGKVNKGIRSTILREPEMFFAYNNGIAATAYGLKTESINGTLYITEIDSLQIVNGGQTTVSLASSLIKDKKDDSEAKIKKISVPVKLSIVTPDKADKLISNIARYANSQNNIKNDDLWSNHPYHIRMEDFSRRISAPATEGRQYGTYWYYERTNGQYAQETYNVSKSAKKKFEESHPKNQKIRKTDFSLYLSIYNKRPDIASYGGQKAFLHNAEKLSDAWKKDNTVFNEEYFKNTVAIAILYKISDKIIKRQDWYRSYKANIIAYTLAKIFYIVETEYPECAVNLKTIWQKQTLSDAWIKQLENASYFMYQYLVREDRDIENVTEWAKREKCWEGAKKLHYDLFPEFISELQSKEVIKQELDDAKKNQKIAVQIDSMVEVVNYGSENWDKLKKWNVTHRVLTPSELHQVDLAIKMDGGLILSEKKCVKVLAILEKCRLEGYTG